jgi:cysteinyl-tRNA synthetase
MSLFQEPPARFLQTLDDMLLRRKNLDRAQIDQLVNERNSARVARDFKRADELRAQLTGMGIQVQDSAHGSEWEVAK